jgi:hypothetical protein
MAKGKQSKADERRARAAGLTRNEFIEFVTEAKAARQELDDASMAHAGVFKRGDGLGVHTQAAKLYLQLDRMEDTKRQDFLRAFDQYREWSNWDAQGDLLEQAVEVAEQAIANAPGEGEGEAEEQVPEQQPEPAEAAAPAEPAVAGAPEADWGELTTDGQPELERAGFVYAEGQRAGAERLGPDDNPHPKMSALHAVWERGRVNPTPVAEEDVEELSPRRGRRRAAATA